MLIDNLKERPNCENCNSPAFMIAYHMMLCGDCVLEINQKLAKKQSDEIKDLLRN